MGRSDTPSAVPFFLCRLPPEGLARGRALLAARACCSGPARAATPSLPACVMDKMILIYHLPDRDVEVRLGAPTEVRLEAPGQTANVGALAMGEQPKTETSGQKPERSAKNRKSRSRSRSRSGARSRGSSSSDGSERNKRYRGTTSKASAPRPRWEERWRFASPSPTRAPRGGLPPLADVASEVPSRARPRGDTPIGAPVGRPWHH